MEDRFNTIAGWALFSGIVALGLSSLSHKYFEADKDLRPEKMGYEIAGVVHSGGGEKAVPFETLLASADVSKGENVFKKCGSCHTATQGGANGTGPNLYGVVGSKIAGRPDGFAYSPALAGHGGNWDFANLNEWLTSPKKFADGTKMTFAGLDSAEDRANVIAYLNAQGSNLPLPKPAAEPAADASAAPAAGASAAPAGAASGAPAAGASAAAKP